MNTRSLFIFFPPSILHDIALQGVLLKLLAQQFEVLHPLSSFQRRYFSLSLLHLMATSFPPPSTQDPPANIPPVFVFRREVSEPQAQCLLQGLQDPYEANRLLCLELLLQLPARTLCLTVSVCVCVWGGGGRGGSSLVSLSFRTLQPFSAHLEHCRQKEKQQILQISHTHCVRPAYPSICSSEASVWSLLAPLFRCSK